MFKAAGMVVVAVWLAMAGLLAHRVYSPVAATVTGPAVEPGEDWMGIYLEGRKIGYAVSRVEVTPGGYAVTEEMLTSLKVQGSSQKIYTQTRSHIDGSFALKDFDFSLKSGIADMEIKGVMDGRTLKLDINTAGRGQKLDLPMEDVPHLSSDIELLLRKEGLEVGRKLRLQFFDPGSLSNQYMEIEVEAKEELLIANRLLPVYRVKERFAGLTATTWISPEIGSVKGEGPMGFTFLKETKEQALRPPDVGAGTVDIIALASIQAKGSLPEPRRAGFMKARLSGADMSGLDLAGGRQGFSGGEVTVTREALDGAGHVKLPLTAPELTKYLRAEPFVQSEDPKIIAKAREILSGETDALAAARKLSGWVYDSLEKKPSAGIPSAVEVLGNLSGDCNEHTVLFTALARAAGIPTKMDAGVVMMDGRFYYHAWPEVYVGRWVSIDPTFGQFPSDATHIRLVEGGPDRQISMLKVIGKLNIDILEYRY